MSTPAQAPESFRDSLATVDKRGRRIWVYPQKPDGKLYTARHLLTPLLLGFMFGAPFIKVHGNPLMLVDILNRRFFIFGIGFWPHDFYLLVLAAIALAIFIILFTAVYGRLFCGWVCPQTIFMEMVFRPIEFLIEGDGHRQRKFDRSPWTFGKITRKTLKHGIFFTISFLIGNTLLAWIIGAERLLHIVTASPAEHPAGFASVLAFSLIFYGVFARFREQACTLVCPYGRLQSVLLGDDTIVIAYDFKRGEPRGKLRSGQDRSGNGDCIDCHACVRVCPTGIDIRDGTQLECVNCTACIDACNKVMKQAKLPPKLIRYSSFNSLSQGHDRRFTPRMIGYTVALTALLSLLTILMVTRTGTETTILRTSGRLHEMLDNGNVRNLYNITVVNKTPDSLHVRLALKDIRGEIKVVGPPLDIAARSAGESVFAVEIHKEEMSSSSTLITVQILDIDHLLEEVRTNFSGPEPQWK